jgi:penicillin-binding protein 1A
VELEEKEEEEEEEKGDGEPSSPVSRERVISPQHAFIMTHLLEGVVQHGTGQRAKVLNRPIAGKTGTSSDYTDAWFIGYSPSLLAAVWVGFDEKTSLGKDETGARAALPIWIAFMSKALAGSPEEEFKAPPGIVMKKVNIETGLPTREESGETIIEAFVEGMLPEEKEDDGKEESPSLPSTRDILPKESPSY